MPEQTEPESTEPESTAPESTQPESTQPQSAEAEAHDKPVKSVEAKKSVDRPKRRPVPPPAAAPSNRGPWLIAAAIGLAAGLAGGAGVAALWHPGSSGGSAKFNTEQVNAAKQDVCSAALLARKVVVTNMHVKNPDPENPIAQLAVAANARLSLTAGAAYLRGRLAADPATPADIADAAQKMASGLEHLNLSYLGGQPNSDREQLGHDLDEQIADLGKLCQ